jgi:hypothetical protein
MAFNPSVVRGPATPLKLLEGIGAEADIPAQANTVEASIADEAIDVRLLDTPALGDILR